MATANDQPANQPARRRGPGRPFERGVSQSARFNQTRQQMQGEVIRDLEEASGRPVSSADRLLVARYVELLRSKSHSDVNTAMKVWAALTSKYSGKGPQNVSAFDRYVADLQAKDAPK
jgi:hypothetical protein